MDTRPEPTGEPSPDEVRRRRVAPAVVIGSALEWFDFYLFASMAALVFGRVFFPGESSVAGTLASIATFAVGFVIRPVGGVLFGLLGDRIGRKRVLSATFLLMGVSSGLIGLIPSYDSIGVLAPVLLVLLRLAQGLGAGAEFGSALAVSYEHSAPRARGRYGSLPALGVNIGLFGSSLVVTVLTSADPQFLESWGWRIPFVASFALVAIGMWVRARMPETPEFRRIAESGDSRPRATPMRDLWRHGRRGVLVVFGVYIGYLSASYVFKTFSLSYLTEFRDLPANIGALGVTVASAVAIAVVPVAGVLADRFPPGRVVAAGAVGVVLLSFPFFAALDTGSSVLIIATMVAATGVIIPIMLAASGAFFAQQFPTGMRASGLGVGREVAGIGGGLAPLAAFALVAGTPGHASWPVALLVLASGVVMVLAVTAGRQRPAPDDAQPAPDTAPGRSTEGAT